ncbi:nucleotide disphospho-sugar-binding domain-containing protein [Acidicapsa acidisoli]|uniref:nucleotide disphospho-sugar-binding domain-containing protein n=1 Tax=Acidicapsa acidisoli TaxID=1615681 RepID=UPI0021DF9877|nr:nucleotide disphospho-sugar-binding domain-containing protein [Acidicapsa acidisoli]
MKVLITSVPLMGHLNAVLSVGRILTEQGHEVIGLSVNVLRDRIEHIGARFVPFSGAADLDLRDFAAAYPEFRTMAPGVEMTRFYFERVFADPLIDQNRDVQHAIETFTPDVIIVDNLFLGILPLLLGPRANRPPIISVGSTYLLWHRHDNAPCNLGLPPAWKNAYAEIAHEIDAAFTKPIGEYINSLLTGGGFPALPLNILDAVIQLPDACLQLTVPDFEFPRADLPPTVHFVGAMPIVPKQAPIPAWADELDDSRKVVFVTQGTVSNHNFTQLVAPTLSALEDDPDLLVVVGVGGRSIDELPKPLPANTRAASYFSLEWLLPKVDVFVTNGGYNTVNQALKHGIPLVTAGLTEDKADVNARVEWSGAGIDLKTNTPTVEALAQAVRSVLNEPHYRSSAAQLAIEFAKFDTGQEVMRVIDELTCDAVLTSIKSDVAR